jgi:hypothetical protein
MKSLAAQVGLSHNIRIVVPRDAFIEVVVRSSLNP